MKITREIKLELVKALVAGEGIFTHTAVSRDFIHLVKYGKVDKGNLVSLYNDRELVMKITDSFPSTLNVDERVIFCVNYTNGSFSANLQDWTNCYFIKIDFDKKSVSIKENTFYCEKISRYTYK
jgi:hypothetical protein